VFSSKNLFRSAVMVGVLCGVGAQAGEPKAGPRQAAAEPELRQGDHGPQVEEVFRFLQTYGYFPNAELARHYPGWKPAVEREPASPSTFDASLEEAVKRYQGAMGLPVTGRVDGRTRALMRQPRCGMPDVSGTTSFVARTPQPQTNLTYAFQNYTPDLPVNSTRDAVIGALARWGAAAPLAFTEMGGTPLDFNIIFTTGDHGDGFPFASNVLAHAFYPACSNSFTCNPLSGDAHFNDAFGWTVNGQAYDLRSTALHEFGHSLGLDHSPDANAVMYATYNGRIDLQPDDLAGIRSLYPVFRDTRTFDAQFYLDAHGDLRNAFGATNVAAASRHWIDTGRGEDRIASPAFIVKDYLARYSDLRAAFGTNYRAALNHWMQAGIYEGRQASPAFSAPYYLSIHADVRNAYGNNYRAAIDHFVQAGLNEGRRGSPEFDPKYYLQANPDVAAAYGATNYRGGLLHWLLYGRNEGRRGAP